MTLAAGQILQDRYRIVSPLRQGGMGAVYRAWDVRLKAPVALKEMVPQPGLASRALAQLRAQFEQEAVILARLNHPQLVRVTDFFEEGGNAYLVMDFIEGESLADRIEREGSLSEAQVLEWAGQLLDALAYCHAQGVIHRDVKPQNVIVRPDGRAVLVDFGLVKLWDPGDPRTKTAMRGMGTPEYAPPEQYDMDAGHTDVRSDIYGLGATLYHALTGRSPPTATQRIASRSAFQPPRALNKRILPATEAAVLRAMELTVEDRFPTAREMATALVGRAPVPARRAVPKRQATRMTSGAQTVARSRRRMSGWAWVVGGLIMLALGTTIIVILVVVDGGGVFTSTPTPSSTPTALPTLTPTYIPTETATHTPIPKPMATVTPRPTSTPASTPTPTATSTPRPRPTATFTPIPPTATAVPLPTPPPPPPPPPPPTKVPPPPATNTPPP
jgi:serine/threonine-protein kinase